MIPKKIECRPLGSTTTPGQPPPTSNNPICAQISPLSSSLVLRSNPPLLSHESQSRIGRSRRQKFYMTIMPPRSARPRPLPGGSSTISGSAQNAPIPNKQTQRLAPVNQSINQSICCPRNMTPPPSCVSACLESIWSLSGVQTRSLPTIMCSSSSSSCTGLLHSDPSVVRTTKPQIVRARTKVAENDPAKGPRSLR